MTPSPTDGAQVHVEAQRHVFDRYKWDQNRAVTIDPITIEDKQLGRLHDVGLAQEFEVRGTATGTSADFTVKP